MNNFLMPLKFFPIVFSICNIFSICSTSNVYFLRDDPWFYAFSLFLRRANARMCETCVSLRRGRSGKARYQQNLNRQNLNYRLLIIHLNKPVVTFFLTRTRHLFKLIM